MKLKLKKILGKIIPLHIRLILIMLYDFLNIIEKIKYKNSVLKLIDYYENQVGIAGISPIISYLKKAKSYTPYPYEWTNIYKNRKIKNFIDKETKLPYVNTDIGKKLYFRKNSFRINYNLISMEMDLRSPHRYVTCENKLIGTIDDYNKSINIHPFYVSKGDVVADLGCAEGNFALSIIDIASHVYLFECDNEWIETLKCTFRDYSHKVTIVNKYVSNVDSDNTVTLDTFFKDKKINFIKADIEGAESDMLEGARSLLIERDDIKVSVCTYHKENDYEDFINFFREINYKTYDTKDYFLTRSNDKSFLHLRKVIIRAEKSFYE